MKTAYGWYESFKTALLETDWTKMPERVQVAESEIHERKRVLSEDHGGTAEERQALADAMNGLTVLRRDAASWQERQNLSRTGNSAQAE